MPLHCLRNLQQRGWAFPGPPLFPDAHPQYTLSRPVSTLDSYQPSAYNILPYQPSRTLLQHHQPSHTRSTHLASPKDVGWPLLLWTHTDVLLPPALAYLTHTLDKHYYYCYYSKHPQIWLGCLKGRGQVDWLFWLGAARFDWKWSARWLYLCGAYM